MLVPSSRSARSRNRQHLVSERHERVDVYHGSISNQYMGDDHPLAFDNDVQRFDVSCSLQIRLIIIEGDSIGSTDMSNYML